MRFIFFPIATFLQYLFEGFLIAAFIDLSFNRGILLTHLGAVGSSGGPEVVVTFLAAIIFFIVGHANSTFAHLFFQQVIASINAFRPSRYFIRQAYEMMGATPEGWPNTWLWRAQQRVMFLIWKPVSIQDAHNIVEWHKGRDDIEPIRNDRCVFARGFWLLSRSANKESFEDVLMNFNFSRNMMSAILICGLIFVIGSASTGNDLQLTYERLGLVDCFPLVANQPPSADMVASGLKDGFECQAVNTVAIGVFYFVTLALLFVRFVYFFGVVTKNILRSLVEPKKESPDVEYEVFGRPRQA